ncbi:hypothetical protein NBO_463g0003 [Nosema bombycis CQ1]|uniref:Uncharacterized protein n=1 Tax=Nosema bombycis (strain CQ1 / CVCC 102059) TaxID=578461 RepID=R0M2S8_NOSB1|nr:hypothetical protein NBO_463g0003 [Nosema bombycis CQ1]|eukprot:EOB12324.1 hypothetical protein NBO_463g0003 [Nosema bombycis CQ1]
MFYICKIENININLKISANYIFCSSFLLSLTLGFIRSFCSTLNKNEFFLQLCF